MKDVDSLITLWADHPDEKKYRNDLYVKLAELLGKEAYLRAGNWLPVLHTNLIPSHDGREAIGPDGVRREVLEGDVTAITSKAISLVRLATGDLDAQERQALLEDNAAELLTNNVVVEQIEWFVTENFLTYAQAVKIGYQLGAPFGARLAADLGTIVKARYGEDVLIGLYYRNSSWIEDATGAAHAPTQVTVESGSFVGWQATAFWDVTVGAVRVQIVTPGGKAFILDPDGNDVTGERPVNAGTAPAHADDGGSYWAGPPVTRDLDAEAKDAALAAAAAAWSKIVSQLSTLLAEQAHLESQIVNNPHNPHVTAPWQTRLEEVRSQIAVLRLELAGASSRLDTMQATPASGFRVPVRAALVGAGLVAAGGVVAVAVGVGGGGGPAPSPATHSVVASPATTPSSLPASSGVVATTPPPAANQPAAVPATASDQPVLTPVSAVFTQSAFHTVYSENATGPGLSYAWTVSIPSDSGCAVGFHPGAPAAGQATWYHADVSEGGACNHGGNDYGASGHPGTVVVTVTNADWSCTASYYGTLSGNSSAAPVCARRGG
ncbi:MAG TPA: hypothetical protein VFW24_11205 [Acidimicrobiales bacterium]|nr:hypothetical protein [Acidimicrobiales bacterium]